MRYYDPFDAAVEPVKPNPAKGDMLAAARGVSSPRNARLKAKAERFEIARDAESWDFGADPMIWARARYGERDLSSAIRFNEARPFENPFREPPKRLISVLALVGALSAIGHFGSIGLI